MCRWMKDIYFYLVKAKMSNMFFWDRPGGPIRAYPSSQLYSRQKTASVQKRFDKFDGSSII